MRHRRRASRLARSRGLWLGRGRHGRSMRRTGPRQKAKGAGPMRPAILTSHRVIAARPRGALAALRPSTQRKSGAM
ncbi:Hypothetical protein A7982_08639 [Minicystis rosea]|nr:Hypothetical protein A7982_08639 [Minicystis rosea]